MSIADEIIRIQNAKQAFKSNLEQRGIAIEDTDTIDMYADLLNTVPYVVRGTFTPEEDITSFSISGLPFKPKMVYIVCNDLHSALVTNSLILITCGEDFLGAALSYDGTKIYSSTISVNSVLNVWGEDNYTFDTSLASSATRDRRFKAGYTYDYIIVGGFD